ncbi:glycosyltransferase family 2 protein [Thermococcus sp. CX2]|uniref:glycosyltransferase family 2 protein n=1 Tax=Thermococcus sp. CX2 TaxID=163006 RepID=UPI001438E964|nr:glycosyltransferase family 2 protein [Thermococcus sp. CX2]NJE86004.1 glycosyltransferase family 2 protein [Thermococcus sp. CX2]
MSYALITPIRNEIENMDSLFKNITSQTIQPVIWVIVDGNSTDGSFEYANTLAKKYNHPHKWIYVIKQKHYFRDKHPHLNFALAVWEGYEYAKWIAKKKKISLEYIGKVDASVKIPFNYFERLLLEFQENHRLGIASGVQYLVKDGKDIKYVSTYPYELPDTRLYRIQCIEDMGGFPITCSPDVVIVLRAINKGWKTKRVEDLPFYEYRVGGSKEGLKNGYISKGKAMYYLGYNPVLIVLNVFYYLSKKSKLGIWMFEGYVTSWMYEEEKIPDREIRKYFEKKRLKEIISLIFSK